MTVAFGFTDRATPIVQVGLADVRTDLPTTAQWDVDLWSDPGSVWHGTEPSWFDITDKVHDSTGTYGRQRATDQFDVGTATLIASNEDGWADPIPPADDPALLTLRAGRQIRMGVTHSTLGTVWKWRGYIDAVLPTYDAAVHDAVEISAVCALGEVGRTPVPERATPIGANELAGTRIARILNAAKWPAAKRSIEPTSTTMLETLLGGQAADLLYVTSESVGGAIYGDTLGRVVFRGRDWQMWMPDMPSSGSIGNQVFTDVPPVSWQPSNRREDLVTQVVLARSTDETPTVWDDAVGQTLYGVEPYEALDLECSATAQLHRLAMRQFRVRGYQTTPRIDSVRLDAAASDAALDLMTAVDPFLPSRYWCRLELERGQVFEREMFVTGVEHHMAPDVWEVNLNLDSAGPWESVAGRWDESSFDQNTWSVTL